MTQPLRLVATCLLSLVVGAVHAADSAAAEEFAAPPDLAPGWYARIETSMGRIVARLLPEQAPQSVAHFAALAEARLEWFDRVDGEIRKDHYYDGIKIHKALAGQRFEAGDPASGHAAPSIHVPPEGEGPINFNAPGRLGMLKDGGANSGVYFFVTASAQPWLTGNFPCFGWVVDGWDVVTHLSQVKTHPNGRPLDPPLIERIRVFSVGDPAPLPEPVAYTPRRVEFEARPMPPKQP